MATSLSQSRDLTSGFGIDSTSAFVFDLDGTLIDSNAAHAETWAAAVREYGLSCDAMHVRPLIGMRGDQLLRRLAGIEEDSTKGRAIVERKKSLFTERLSQLRPTRGARALVSYLRDRQKDIVIATSGDEEEMLALLEQAGIAGLIPCRTSKDDAPQSKPDPDTVQAALSKTGSPAARAVMIGDTPYDIEAAHRAEIEAIALRCGGHWSDAQLYGAIAIFDDPAALLAQWQRDPGVRSGETVV